MAMPAGGILASRTRQPTPGLVALAIVLALALGPAALAQGSGVAPPSQWGAAACSGHGHTQFGRCFCDPRWSGDQCETPEQPLDCGEHGKASHGWCVCEPG